MTIFHIKWSDFDIVLPDYRWTFCLRHQATLTGDLGRRTGESMDPAVSSLKLLHEERNER